MISRNAWDNVVVVVRDGETDQTWDGKVKNLIYDVDTMAWIAQTASSGGGGGGGDASAANQLTEIATLESIDQKLGSDYVVQKDEASATEIYFGYANPGTATSSASWKIKKMTIDGSDFNVKFADGNSNFDNTWDNRASLSYS